MQDNDITMIPIDQINAEFTDETEPRDERLIELLRGAYTHALQCCFALIDFEKVSPFSNFQPKISEPIRKYFDEAYKNGKAPALTVYENGDEYVMSDDYDAYYLYKEKHVDFVPCIVLDPSERTLSLQDASKPYYLELPGHNS